MAAYWEIAAHSAYDMLSWYLIFYLVFPPRFLSWNFFLIAPFHDYCLPLPFQNRHHGKMVQRLGIKFNVRFLVRETTQLERKHVLIK